MPDPGIIAACAACMLIGYQLNNLVQGIRHHIEAKRTPKPKPRVLPIPDEHARRILELFDAYMALPRNEDNAARYDLWKALHECVPEAQTGAWRLDTGSGGHPRLVERLDEPTP